MDKNHHTGAEMLDRNHKIQDDLILQDMNEE